MGSTSYPWDGRSPGDFVVSCRAGEVGGAGGKGSQQTEPGGRKHSGIKCLLGHPACSLSGRGPEPAQTMEAGCRTFCCWWWWSQPWGPPVPTGQHAGLCEYGSNPSHWAAGRRRGPWQSGNTGQGQDMEEPGWGLSVGLEESDQVP